MTENEGGTVDPWIDKAQRLTQFAADAWQRILCIETTNVWNDCAQLAPNESHGLDLSLWGEAIKAEE